MDNSLSDFDNVRPILNNYMISQEIVYPYKDINTNLYGKNVMLLDNSNQIESNIPCIDPLLDIVIAMPNNDIAALNMDGGLTIKSATEINIASNATGALSGLFIKHEIKPRLKLSIPDAIDLHQEFANPFCNTLYKDHDIKYKCLNEGNDKTPFQVTHKVFEDLKYTIYIDVHQFRKYNRLMTIPKGQDLIKLSFVPIYSLSKNYTALINNIYIIIDDVFFTQFNDIF